MSRPSAEAMRSRSCGSLVAMTSSFRASAPTTTQASTRSSPPLAASADPAERACSALSGSIRHPRNSRESCACGPPLHAWPKTAVDSTGRSPDSSRRRCSAHMRLEPRSAAISAPVSYVAPLTQPAVSPIRPGAPHRQLPDHQRTACHAQLPIRPQRSNHPRWPARCATPHSTMPTSSCRDAQPTVLRPEKQALQERWRASARPRGIW